MTLLNRSIAAGWLIVAIVLLRPFLRRVSRSICCALWGLVAFRLLCPFSFESVLSLIPKESTIPTVLHPYGTGGVVSAGTPVSDELISPIPSASTVTVSPMQTALNIVSVMWIVGVALFALYALVSYLRLLARVRISAREDGYWVCERIGTPFVLGFFRPRIYLPLSVNARDIPYILAHERAHIARRDHLRKAFAFALLTVFWFHPFVWVAFFLLCRDIEFACDERALRTLGMDAKNKKDYAEALVRESFPRLSILTCPLAFGGLQVRQRVLSVAKYRKPALSLVLAAILVCGAVAVCFLTDPKAEAGAPIDISESESDASADDATPDAEKPTEEDSAKHPDREPLPSWLKDAKIAEAVATPIEPSVVAFQSGENLPQNLSARFAYCFKHFTVRYLSDEGDSSTVIMITNNGDADGSATYLVYDEYCSFGDEIVTILLPAGENTVYDFGRRIGYVVIGASYDGVSVEFPLQAYKE